MIKFLVDQNVPKSVGMFLRNEGYDVEFVRELDPELPDEQIAEVAIQEKRIVITNDKDFISLGIADNQLQVIVFDFRLQDANVRINALRTLLASENIPEGIIVLQ